MREAWRIARDYADILAFIAMLVALSAACALYREEQA